MKINGTQLLENLKTLRQFTDTPGKGVTRFSYGENDRKAREYLLSQAREIGCSVEVDALKNVRIRRRGAQDNRERVVIGSHVDTVRNGGWLDGIYGVTSGVEVLRSLRDAALEKDLELVIFAEEEGSNFGSTMTGSKFISGQYGIKELDSLKNDEGVSLREMLGSPADNAIENVRWDFSRISAMLELHIEQGPVLEREGLPLGIVDAIFGMQVIEVELEGVGNHAGATPMVDRRDALCAASACILDAESLVKADGRAVATVGRIRVEPDCSNVIPEKAVFTLEVRDSEEASISAYMEKIEENIRRISRERNVSCRIRRISQSKPFKLAENLISQMEQLASQKQIPYKRMNSGAVHDACMIAPFADTGMIFVPSIGGRSHVPEENTGEAELLQGAQFLLELAERLTGAKLV